MTPQELVSDALDAVAADANDEIVAGAQSRQVYQQFIADPLDLLRKSGEFPDELGGTRRCGSDGLRGNLRKKQESAWCRSSAGGRSAKSPVILGDWAIDAGSLDLVGAGIGVRSIHRQQRAM